VCKNTHRRRADTGRTPTPHQTGNLGWKPTARGAVVIVSGEHLFWVRLLTESQIIGNEPLWWTHHPRSVEPRGTVRAHATNGSSTRRFETSGGRVREKQTRRVVGVLEPVLWSADSLPDDWPGAERRRPYLFLRKHDATRRKDAGPARPVHEVSRNRHKRFPRVRTRLDTPVAAEFVTTNSSIWCGHDNESYRSAARMIDTLGTPASAFT
jgi:hypothetical protein